MKNYLLFLENIKDKDTGTIYSPYSKNFNSNSPGYFLIKRKKK